MKSKIWLWVVVGRIVASIATLVLKFGAVAVIYVAHQSAGGILYWALSLVEVTLSEGAAGYVAARLSGPRGPAAALAVGTVGLVLLMGGIVFLGTGTLWPWWMYTVYAGLIIPSAVLGGRLAKRA